MPPLTLYTDGSYDPRRKVGGWAAILVEGEGRRYLYGREGNTTSQRLELLAALKGLEAVPEGAEVQVVSDSQYLIRGMTGRARRHTNHDLWERLDALASRRRVRWRWAQGHQGDRGNEEANALASWQAGVAPRPLWLPQEALSLTHLDERGQARMVDVGGKGETEREAVARGTVVMRPETLALIREGRVPKGDVLAVARLAGVLGAKLTPHLVPLCHPIPLTQVQVDMEVDEERSALHITATARAVARTGVEMEALTAVVASALAVYDMCKAVDRGIRIEGVRLLRKRGGKSGEIIVEED